MTNKGKVTLLIRDIGASLLTYNQDPFMMKQVGFVETFIAAIIFIFSVPELIPDQKRAETSSKWQRKAVHPGKNFSKW